jgi:hypothetical protein
VKIDAIDMPLAGRSKAPKNRAFSRFIAGPAQQDVVDADGCEWALCIWRNLLPNYCAAHKH